MKNVELSTKILKTLNDIGVRHILVCAGARNAPFVYLLEKIKNVKVWNFFEERSAGFFALGLAQSTKSPIAVITTSGTAVAELLPAVIEAALTKTPLLVITADRPSAYRGSGAPQAIEQVDLFARYVEKCLDIEGSFSSEHVLLWAKNIFSLKPLHLNVCFDEPLIDAEIPEICFTNEAEKPLIADSCESAVSEKLLASAITEIQKLSKPLVIVGALTDEEAQLVAPYLIKLGAPIYAEGISNLRKFAELSFLSVQANLQTEGTTAEIMQNLEGDVTPKLQALFSDGICQSVIRLGGVPTLRLWRDLEAQLKHVPVVSFTRTGYSGLSRANKTFSFEMFLQICKRENLSYSSHGTIDRCALVSRFAQAIKAQPASEVALLSQLAIALSGQHVYLGNSLPIRQWDMVATWGKGAPALVTANRGANGIDGQISSFLGLSEGLSDLSEHWGIFGDLTTMYDLSGLWPVPQMLPRKLRVVVINNFGGMIFKNMFGKKLFLNTHEQQFKKWAEMWNFTYNRWTHIPSVADIRALPDHCVIEIVPDASQTEKFWQELKK